MDAVNAAYQVIVPRDAVAGIPADYGTAIIDNMLSLLATVTTSDDAHERLRNGVGRWRMAADPVPAKHRGRSPRQAPVPGAAELTTTFASSYTREVSLAGMLRPDAFHAYIKRATGEKFLVTPQAHS
jgi:hypothetical protein